MKVQIKDTFFQSLVQIAKKELWYWRLYDLMKYDIPRFFRNVWLFRRALKNHTWWDHHGMLGFLEVALEDMAEKIEDHGIEVDSTRLKKVQAMRRAAQIIRNYNFDLSYLEMAEAELGSLYDGGPVQFVKSASDSGTFEMYEDLSQEQKDHNSAVYKRAQELENLAWIELWEIFKGQDYKKFSDDLDWESQFDGSGMRGWWD